MTIQVGLKVLNGFQIHSIKLREKQIHDYHKQLQRAHRTQVKSIEHDIKWTEIGLSDLRRKWNYGEYKRLS